MKHRHFWVVLALILCVGVTAAQYDERWFHSDGGLQAVFFGAENTDADNAREIALAFNVNPPRVVVVDGLAGDVDTVVGGMTSLRETACRLVDTDNDGRYEILVQGQPAGGVEGWHLYEFGGVGVNGRPTYAPVPAGSELEQNTPNPFGEVTRIAYSVASPSRVILHLYDVTGRVVRTLDDGTRKAGAYTAYWDGRDDKGARLTPGTYFYELEVNNKRESRKMILTQ